MKQLFIESITADSGTVTEFYQVAQVEKKDKKDGTSYLSMKLADRTGTVDAKCWFIPDGADIVKGAYVKVEATCGLYRDALQLKVVKIRLATTEDGVQREDFMPASKRDRAAMFAELLDVVLHRVNHRLLRFLLLELLDNNRAALLECPAASSKHQAYLGGLLEHILSLCTLANGVCDHYPDLNRDILIAAAVIHDIGKLEELVYDTHIGYSRAGELCSHVMQGAVIWSKYSGGLGRATKEHLEHIIASHHGRKEWRALSVPMTREAHIFHCLDYIDAGYELIGNAVAAGTDAEGMTPYNFTAGTAYWNGK